MVKVKKQGQGQLFNSAFLEVYTRTHPAIHVITYGSAIALYLYLNNLQLIQTILYFGIGIVGWTLTEYIVHRYLFHIKESKFQYLIHGVHHEYPRDRERLMMPPVPGAVLLSAFTGIFYIVFREATFAYMAGFTAMYIVYTFIHYIIHAWKPIPGLKFLWSHHHKHHNPASENKAYGVSTPLWDIIFGTMPK